MAENPNDDVGRPVHHTNIWIIFLSTFIHTKMDYFTGMSYLEIQIQRKKLGQDIANCSSVPGFNSL